MAVVTDDPAPSDGVEGVVPALPSSNSMGSTGVAAVEDVATTADGPGVE